MDIMTLVATLGLDSSGFNKGLDDAKNTVEKTSGGISGALGKAAKIGAAGVAAATTAVVAFGKTAVDAGMTFDSSMSQVAATMGKTTDEMENEVGTVDLAWGTFSGNLREYAQEMGSKTAFSATQAADALNYMALAGYDTQTAMEMLPNVLNLAAAGSMDLGSASDMVTDASSALNLSLEETAELVDKMAQTSTKSNTSVSQLGEAILTVGGTATNLAGGTTELTTALGILADNSIKGSEGGTALRNIILSLADPTKDAKDALLQFGGAEKLVYDEAGNMRPLNDIFGDLNSILGEMDMKGRTELLNTMFNKTDLRSVNALLAGTAAGTGEINDALESSGVAWEKYSDKVWATEDVFSGLIADLAYNLGEVGTSAKDLQEYLQFEYDIDAEDAMKIIEAASGAIDGQINRWDELSGSIDDAQGAAQNMADTQLDNLAGDITLFKSALEGAQIAISDQLTPTLRDFVKLGSEGLSNLTEAFKEKGLSGAMEALGTWISDALSMIIEKIPDVINAGTQLLMALIKGIIDNLPMMTEAALNAVLTLADGISNSLPTLIPAIMEAIYTMMITLYENADKLVEAALRLMRGFAEGIIASIPVILEKIPQMLNALVNALINSIPKIADTGVELIGSIVKNLPEIISKVVVAIPQIIAAIAKAIIQGVPTIVNAGVNLISGLGQGIINGAVAVINSAKQVASDVLSAIKGFFGIHSPSSVMDKEVGQMLGRGEVKGLRKTFPDIKRTAMEMRDIITDNAFDSNITVQSGSSYATGREGNPSESGTSRTEQLLITIVETLKTMGISIDGRAMVGYLMPEINRQLGQMINRELREAAYI